MSASTRLSVAEARAISIADEALGISGTILGINDREAWAKIVEEATATGGLARPARQIPTRAVRPHATSAAGSTVNAKKDA